VNPVSPNPNYEASLRDILTRRDWQALREFSRTENQVPDDIYNQDQHFWDVLVHKLTCSRIDLLGLHDESRAWLTERGYSTDLGGY
jgi:hypothetical protein